MARYSANGRRIGRPPGSGKHQQAAIPNADLFAAVPSEDRQALAVGRAVLKHAARYDAAGRGRRMAGWSPPSSGPNTATAGLQTIRDRSRDATRNDWSSESVVQKWSTSLIGIGITPRWRRIKSKTRKQAVIDLWQDFVATADADCVLDLYGLQTLVTRAWLESGECFVRRRNRFLDEGLPVPMQIQVLEADMVPLFNSTSEPGLPVGHVIKQGIEFNKRGKRIAYWFHKEHPGDGFNAATITSADLVRVLATDVCHVFEPKRPGQLRGVPVVAPVLTRLRNVGDYEDVTLERQKIANLWVGFISRSLPQMEDVNGLTGVPDVLDDGGQPLVPLKPGLIQELEDGQTMNFANPPEAGTSYSDYLRTSHLGTAAAGGLPYELFSGDIREISDRTLRVVINEFRRFAEQRQWQIVIPQFCQRVINWFADAGALAGLIGLEEIDDVRRVEHAPHGWAYIHPVQDPQGKKLEVEAGFRSRASVVGESGDDVEQVDEERQQDDLREQALEIGPYSKAANVEPEDGDADGDADGIDDDEYSAPPNVAARSKALHEAQLDALRARADRDRRPSPSEATAHVEADLMRATLALIGGDGGHP